MDQLKYVYVDLSQIAGKGSHETAPIWVLPFHDHRALAMRNDLAYLEVEVD